VLEGIDPHSPVWKAVQAWAETELEKCRIVLERPQPPDKSDNLRGYIAALRDVLKLGEPEAGRPEIARPPGYFDYD
jgi:hypothetical protein